MPEQTLGSLFSEFPFPILSGNPAATRIERVVADSRVVKPGDLFVATIGGQFDAHRAIPEAIRKGAAGVVGMEAMEILDIPYIRVENSRQALAYLAAASYGYPARHLTIIGVTGTDGKTTTCNLLYQIMVEAGIKAGMISTVNAMIGDQILDTGFHVTTPDALDVQRYLSQMMEAGLTHIILETTSHGWAQFRVDACEIDIGVVTNISHEHLDEHGSYENYRAAKARLFRSLAATRPKPGGVTPFAVLNADDMSFEYLKSILTTSYCSYGLTAAAEVSAGEIHYGASGIHFKAKGMDWELAVTSKLVGAFNVTNCLAALTAAVYGLGIPLEQTASGIANLEGIPGRMEWIDLGQDFTAIVDFAHTPNALKNALQTVRSMTRGRVIVVFGSAGLRDREKRRIMAEVSVQLADFIVLTAEDPRTESLTQILEEMAAGAISKGGLEGQTFWRIPDRGNAIGFALTLAQPGDIVLVCGKGHEQSMCFGETEYPWDDRTALRAALADYLKIAGPEMPYLPTKKDY